MKTKIALTPTLSHPMGQGTAAAQFSLRHISQPAFVFNSPKSCERFSLSLSERERAGVRVP
jgi:hypothetical protein